MPTIERIFNKMRFGVLTVSDSCYKQQNVDKSGPQITALIKSRYAESIVIYEDIVPDELERIKAKLTEWSDDICDVVFTTGGTGIADRDVTPEATKAIIDKEVPGISFVMMNKSLASTPFAMLSRAVCGIRKKTLIINFPGSVKAVTENFEAICEIIPHAISLLQNKIEDIQKIHSRLAQLPQIQPRPEHVTLVPDAISLQNKIEDVQKINSRIAHFSQLQPRPENITLVPATSATTFLTPSNVIINTANRPRTSPYEMVSMDNALGIVTMNCGQTANTEVFPIINLMGRVLAEDIRSRDPLPPFAASIKDGYAVKSSDGAGLRTVVDAKAAGDNPKCPELQSGQCVRISTGAAVPPGADAVVQVEDTELVKSSEDSTQELQINIKVAPKPGQDIRPIGSDIPANTIVLPKGSIINASEIGVLAAVGQTRASVFKRLTIGIISTGNEVQDPNEPLQPGKIRDSNKITLICLLKQYTYDASDFGHAIDDPTVVKHSLAKAFENCDVVITTGGVSMGEFDVMKKVLEVDFNAKIHFGRVNMKPGKPTTFATLLYNDKKKILFGLPGNPVSATVTCLLFVIPALRYSENRNDYMYPEIQVTPNFKPVFDAERPEYQRVKLNYVGERITADTTGNQISSKLNSFTGADGLMYVLPYKLKEGETKQNCSYHKDGKTYSCYILNKY